MDRLNIVGLELWVKVGCSAEERAFPQRVEVDVSLELSLQKAGVKDDLSETEDYAALAAAVKKAVESREFALAEAVAEKIAAAALQNKKIKSAMVRVRKRALPGINYAEVVIQRGRLGLVK